MRHTAVMAGTGAIGLLAVFAVDLLNLLYISLLGDRALTAAIGFTGAVGMLQLSVSIGMSIGLGACVSRLIGADRRDEARRVASSALVGMAIVMLAIGLAAVALRRPILHGLGATDGSAEAAAAFVSVVSPFLPLIGLGMAFSALLRAVGDARRSMTVTLWGALITALLDPALILGLHLGLQGAAISTVISRGAVALLGFLSVRRHDLLQRPEPRCLLPDARRIGTIAMPAILTNLATPVGGAYTTHAMAHFGLPAVAGLATIDRIVPVAFAFIFALTGSVGPIMSQNLGAGLLGRVRDTLRASLLLVLGCVLVMWAVLAVAQNGLVLLFSAHGATASLLRLFCSATVASFLWVGALFVANAAFNNLGHPLLSTLFNWGRATLGTIPFVTLGMRWGPAGVLVGQAAGGVVFGTFAVITAFIVTARLRAGEDGAGIATSPDVPASSAKAAMAELSEIDGSDRET
ncbi:MATE family efflux transporter [Rhizosaccharibacter radicis]|uniref:MATE family efflux transporter n=1 Tax=Rhizosaccharibacter radicis TaxID=2782605 RepID=A0ABT1VTL1_9PROT|nr:MATE family efflux transporter [Acetobacteraceae bacterium KSS12]